MSRDDYVRVDCEVVGEVGKALHINTDAGNGTKKWHYLPISQISEIHKQDGWIMLKKWLASKEGLN